MVLCSILGCNSRSERKIENITFHSFPQDPKLRERWVQATGRKNWVPTKNQRVCSKHFQQECFRKTQFRMTYLHWDSVPTLFLNQHESKRNTTDDNDEEVQDDPDNMKPSYVVIVTIEENDDYNGTSSVEKDTFKEPVHDSSQEIFEPSQEISESSIQSSSASITTNIQQNNVTTVGNKSYSDRKKTKPLFVSLEDCGDRLEKSQCYCKECMILFATRNDLDVHKMNTHSFLVAVDTPEQTYPVPEQYPPQEEHQATSNSIYSIYSMDVPIINSNTTYLVCQICSCYFISKAEYYEHDHNSSGDAYTVTSSVDSPVMCKYCEHVSKNPASHNTHIRLIHYSLYSKSRYVKNPSKAKNVYARNKSMSKCSDCNLSLDNINSAKFRRCHVHENHIKSVVAKSNPMPLPDKVQNSVNRLVPKIVLKKYDSTILHTKSSSKEIPKEKEFPESTLKGQTLIKPLKKMLETPNIVTKEQRCTTEKLVLYYCNFCKMALKSLRTRQFHNLKKCKNTISINNFVFCYTCGFKFNNRSFHKKVHTEKKTLKDFKFICIKTLKPRDPPIYEFFVCTTCKIHSLYPHKSNHCNCSRTHETCNICNKLFSPKAYQLHLIHHEIMDATANKNIKSKNPQSNLILNREKPKPDLKRSNVDFPESMPKRKKSSEEIVKQFNIVTKELGIKSKTPNISQDSTPMPWNLLYNCTKCYITTDSYDDVIDHCQRHIDAMEDFDVIIYNCDICFLKFEQKYYKRHMELHQNQTIDKNSFTILNYDFLSILTDDWLKLFDPLPKELTRQILSDSIYVSRFIKMTVIQNGPPEHTMYKCLRCKKFVATAHIVTHTTKKTCIISKRIKCYLCNFIFSTKIAKETHMLIHKTKDVAANSFRIVTFNHPSDLHRLTVMRYNAAKNSISKCNKEKQFSLTVCPKCRTDFPTHLIKFHKCIKKRNNNNSNKHQIKKPGVIPTMTLYRCTGCRVAVPRKEMLEKHKPKCVFYKIKYKTNSDDTRKELVYKCNECDVYMLSGHEVRLHKNRNDEDHDIRLCSICEWRLSKESFDKHVSLHHTVSKLTPKDFCVVEFGDHKPPRKTYNDKDQHIVQCNQNKEVEEDNICNNNSENINCNVENVETSEQQNVNANTYTTLERKYRLCKNTLFRCSKCDIHYTTIKAWINHVQCKHRLFLRILECRKCGLKFNSKSLKKHVMFHKKVYNIITPDETQLGHELEIDEIATMSNITEKVASQSVGTNESEDEEIAPENNTAAITIYNDTSHETNIIANEPNLRNHYNVGQEIFTNTNENANTYTTLERKYRLCKNTLFRCSKCDIHYTTIKAWINHVQCKHRLFLRILECRKCGLKFNSKSLKKHVMFHKKVYNIITPDETQLGNDLEMEIDKIATMSNITENVASQSVGTIESEDEEIAPENNTAAITIYNDTSYETNIIANEPNLRNHYNVGEEITTNTNESVVSQRVNEEEATEPEVEHTTSPKYNTAPITIYNNPSHETHNMPIGSKLPNHYDVGEEIFTNTNQSVVSQKVDEKVATEPEDDQTIRENNTAPGPQETPTLPNDPTSLKTYRHRIYKCKECDVHFMSRRACIKHMFHHIPIDPKEYIECKFCNLAFKIVALNVHIKKHHDKDLNLDEVLVEEFSKEDGKTLIVKFYYAIDGVQSRSVSTTFNEPASSTVIDIDNPTSKTSHGSHVTSHFEGLTVLTSIQPKNEAKTEASTNSNENESLYIKVKSEYIANRKHKCRFCDETFNSKTSKEFHESLDHLDFEKECEICKSSFNISILNELHLNIGNNTFECCMCRETLDVKDMSKHAQEHSLE